MVLGCESYDFWYCLPDSRLLIVCNPETSSRVTLATLGTVFQTALHNLEFTKYWWYKVTYYIY